MASESDSLSKQFLELVGERKVLVVEPAITVRTSLQAALTELGVNQNRIVSVSNDAEAFATVTSAGQDFAILFTEYFVGGRSGVELAEELFKDVADLRNVLVVVLTASAHQSNVVEAAEGLVDGYLLKPFSAASLRGYLRKIIEQKLKPNPVAAILYEYRLHWRKGEYEVLRDRLVKEIAQDPTGLPMMRHFWLGRTHAALKEPDLAFQEFQKVLEIQPKHFFALTQIYRTHAERGELRHAYAAIKRLAALFPLTPKALCEALELAVKTEAFSDVETYYELFLETNERREKLVRIMAAALFVGGLDHLQKGVFTRAIDFLEKAVITSRRDPRIISRAIFRLLEANRTQAATQLLNRFEPADHDKDEYVFSKFLVESQAGPGREVDERISTGIKLVERKNCPASIFRIVSALAEKRGNKTIAEEIRLKGQQRYSLEIIGRSLFDVGDPDPHPELEPEDP